jgi:hypothetical protein
MPGCAMELHQQALPSNQVGSFSQFRFGSCIAFAEGKDLKHRPGGNHSRHRNQPEGQGDQRIRRIHLPERNVQRQVDDY